MEYEERRVLAMHLALGVLLEASLPGVKLLMQEKSANHHQGGKIYVIPVFLLPVSRHHPGEDLV